MNNSNGIYSSLVSNYSDSELINILQNGSEYSLAQVNACKEEANRRELNANYTTPLSEGKSISYVMEVKNRILSGESIEQCKSALREKGLNQTQANDIINQVLKIPEPKIESPYTRNEHYGIPLILGIGTLALIIKIVIKVMSL